MKRETSYGQAATGNYLRMPFNRCNLGRGQGLIDDRWARGAILWGRFRT